MKFNKVVTLTSSLIPLMAGIAYAGGGGGTSPMAAVFTTVEGWLTGDISEFLGVAAIVGLGALIWFAHDYGHIFGYVFKGILGVAVAVFAITEYTTAFGGGATIGGTAILAYASILPSVTLAVTACSLIATIIGRGATR